MVFADSFYDLGWLKKTGEEEAPPTAALAEADAVPAPDLNGEATPAGTVSASPAVAAATPVTKSAPVATPAAVSTTLASE